MLVGAAGALAASAPGSASAAIVSPTYTVANSGNNSVSTYSAPGILNVAPLRSIMVTLTGLKVPVAVALSRSGQLFVANRGANTITVYSATQTGNVAPARKPGSRGRTRSR